MKIKLIFIISLVLSSISLKAQKDLYRSKGFYNITQLSMSAHTYVGESDASRISTPNYFNSHAYTVHSDIGFLSDLKSISPFWLMGIDLGIGISFLRNPAINIIPVSMGLKLFFNNLDNSLFLSAKGYGSIYVENRFKKSGDCEIGVGYKFFLFDMQCFVAQVSFRQQLISMTSRNFSFSPHTFNMGGIVFSIGIMPF